MKKIALVGLTGLLAGCAFLNSDTVQPARNITEEYLLGTWVCVTDYDSLGSSFGGIKTSDKTTFKADKSYTNYSFIEAFEAFYYKTRERGNWKLVGTDLIIQEKGKRTAERFFMVKEMEEALKNDPQYADLKKKEQSLYDVFRGNHDGITATFKITGIAKDRFYYEQSVLPNSGRTDQGSCSRRD